MGDAHLRGEQRERISYSTINNKDTVSLANEKGKRKHFENEKRKLKMDLSGA